MGRYSKSYSNFILSKKHQNITDGVIFERDWVTIGNVHRLEPGKKPYFGDAGFIFTDNSIPFFKKKHDYGKWVAHFVYDDVKDATNKVNAVKLNKDSDDLRFYAYYGSMSDMVRASVENIVATFPGRMELTDEVFKIDDIDGSVIDTDYFVIDNYFGLDLYTETTSIIDFDNTLKYLDSSWRDYVVSSYDDNDDTKVVYSPITSYAIENLIDEILRDPKYYNNGYDYLFYKDTLYKWDSTENMFLKVEYGENCNNYFQMCDEYIRFGGSYYQWDQTEGYYIELHNVYELCDDNNQNLYKITIVTGDEKEYVIRMYRIGNGDTYCFDPDESSNSFITIEPNKNVIDTYFETLDGFERKLLNRNSNPLYTNTFKVPFKLPSESYTMVDRLFTWPSSGYCIDAVSPSFESFVNALIDAANIYDELYSDSIWRCMTHESIKNFDWTYRRVFSNTDEQENIEGGNRMMELMHLYGRIYDEARMYIEGIKMSCNVSYDGYRNIPDAELSDKNNIHGWDIVSTIWEAYYYKEIEKKDIPEGTEPTPLPFVPINVNSESPEYIKIGCATEEWEQTEDEEETEELEEELQDEPSENETEEEETSTTKYYHKEYNNPSSEFLTEAFLTDEDYIIGKYESWITHNHNIGYWDMGCEIDEGITPEILPSIPTVIGDESPEYISVDGIYYRKGYMMYCEVPYDPTNGTYDYWNQYNTLDKLPCDIKSDSPRYIRVYGNGSYRYYILSDTSINNEKYQHSLWFNSRNVETTTPVNTDISFQRRLLLSSNRILKTKGTMSSIEMVFGLFGLGFDGENPDFSIRECHLTTPPYNSEDIFYFYEEILDEPDDVDWNDGSNPNKPTNSFTTFEEAIANGVNESSPKDIRTTDNGVYRYYSLNDEYTYMEMVVELSRHKIGDRIYNDYYSGVPLGDIMLGNNRYIIPYHTNTKTYDGYLYFQQKGGWGKWVDKNNSTEEEEEQEAEYGYNYSETVPYLHMMPNMASLLSVVSLDLEPDDIYYVFDTSDYVDYDEDVPYMLSNFFKCSDIYNPQFFSSWKNIPMEGNIVYDKGYVNSDGVTHYDYLHAKYLNDIIPTVLFNNPHTGIGKYDDGEDFLSYMRMPYKYACENYAFDDERYVNIAKQFVFSITPAETPVFDEETMEYATEKVSKHLNEYHFEEVEEAGEMVLKKINTFSDNGTYYLNSKVIILKNENNTHFHNKFLKDIVMKYVLQVIPSTTILILENFNEANTDEMDKFKIQTSTNDENNLFGSTEGDGEYVATTYAILRAKENEGYHFTRWVRVTGDNCVFPEEETPIDNGVYVNDIEEPSVSEEEDISTDPVIKVMVCEDACYKAYFEKDCAIRTACEDVCDLDLSCETEEHCTITLSMIQENNE